MYDGLKPSPQKPWNATLRGGERRDNVISAGRARREIGHMLFGDGGTALFRGLKRVRSFHLHHYGES